MSKSIIAPRIKISLTESLRLCTSGNCRSQYMSLLWPARCRFDDSTCRVTKPQSCYGCCCIYSLLHNTCRFSSIYKLKWGFHQGTYNNGDRSLYEPITTFPSCIRVPNNGIPTLCKSFGGNNLGVLSTTRGTSHNSLRITHMIDNPCVYCSRTKAQCKSVWLEPACFGQLRVVWWTQKGLVGLLEMIFYSLKGYKESTKMAF